MMLYLTGAKTSIVKSEDSPQTDPMESLGGYVSSTVVPNASLNALFDQISSYTLEKRQKETVAIALVNKYDYAVSNVQLKIVAGSNNVAKFRVAAVAIDSDTYQMEKIANRYSEPMNATFHDATFERAHVELKITRFAAAGEAITLQPFNVTVNVETAGQQGTWQAFSDAFEDSDEYTVTKVSDSVYRISRKDETVYSEAVECSYETTGNFTAEFQGGLQNGTDNTVLLAEYLGAGEAIGLWIQRVIRNRAYLSNEQLLYNYKHRIQQEEEEEVEVIVSWSDGDEEIVGGYVAVNSSAVNVGSEGGSAEVNVYSNADWVVE